MTILKSIIDAIQAEFKKSYLRGALFIAVLLAIMLPIGHARSSKILRIINSLFGFSLCSRRFYLFMASPKLPWQQLWHCVWRLIPSPLIEGRLILVADDSINPKTGKKNPCLQSSL